MISWVLIGVLIACVIGALLYMFLLNPLKTMRIDQEAMDKARAKAEEMNEEAERKAQEQRDKENRDLARILLANRRDHMHKTQVIETDRGLNYESLSSDPDALDRKLDEIFGPEKKDP